MWRKMNNNFPSLSITAHCGEGGVSGAAAETGETLHAYEMSGARNKHVHGEFEGHKM